MGHPVDSIGRTRHDDELLSHEPRHEFHGHVFAITGGCTSADNRDGSTRAFQSGAVAPKPQGVRGMVAELTQAERPRVVSRNHDPCAHAGRNLELCNNMCLFESCCPSCESLAQFIFGGWMPAIREGHSCAFDVGRAVCGGFREGEGVGGSVHVNQRSGDAVAGFDDA